MSKKIIKLILIFLLLEFSVHAIAQDLLIKNARIINPDKKMQPQQGYIIIHDDRIKKVGYGNLKAPSGANIYDAKNQYIIPGLIDSHSHIDTVLGMDDEQFPMHPSFVTDYRKQLPRSFLYFGYTTIIDLVSVDQEAFHAFNANLTHPDLYSCGGGVAVANGYPMNDLPEKIRFKMYPNFLYEPNQNIKLPAQINFAQHTPSAIIKNIMNSHAICVKIFYEPGFGIDQNLPLPSLASIKELTTLAHRHNLPVLIHANSYKAQKFALASGADIFAHGLWNWNSYDGETGLPLQVKNILDQVINKNLGYQPTMQVIGGMQALLGQQFLNDPQLRNVVPDSLLTWYRTAEGQWYVHLIMGNSPKLTTQKRLQTKEDQLKRVVNYLQKKHANLLFGTDTPSSPTYGNPPGYNGYLEMNAWHDAGVSLSEILRAATIRNAKIFHLEKNYGTISAGKFANLVILKQNPLQDVSAYDSITSIILHGKIYNRSEFLAN